MPREERLFSRAEAILEGRANGLAIPILRLLAHHGYEPALLALAIWLLPDEGRCQLGRACVPSSPAWLMRRAYRLGSSTAAQNYAMTCFYIGDLAGYRRWMRRAGRLGDAEARLENARFEVRQPYPLARNIRRHRPKRRDER
jgi:hypothetical protein